MIELTTSYQMLAEKTIGVVGICNHATTIRIYAKCDAPDYANKRTTVYYEARGYHQLPCYSMDGGTTASVSGTGASGGSYSGGIKIEGEVTLCSTQGEVSYDSDGTKTISCSAYLKYSDKYGWGGGYDWEATASANATLPAIPLYTVNYDANKGSGAPSSQTKWHNIALELSSTVPTRAGYRFLGWAETSTATTAAYSAGDSYTTDAATTLYAVWESIYSVIYYKTDGETIYLTSNINLDGTLTITSTVPPISKGYRFLGWKSSLDNKIYPIGGIISNIDKSISLIPVIEKYPYSFCIKTTEEKVLGMCVKTSDEEKISDFCIKI